MFKKLLSLSIALVMLSTAAFIAPETSFIAEKASAAEVVTEEFGHAKYEILRVQPVTETTQKITKQTSNVSSGKTNSWYLVKVDIGKDWGSFTSITCVVRVLAAKGKNYRYITSLTKADYDAAFEAAGKTVDNFLTEPRLAPVNAEYMWKDGSNFSGNTSSQNPSLTLSEGRYTYSDGCLYFATQFTSDNTSYPYVGMRVADTSKPTYFVTTVKGTKLAPVVDDFSDSVITWNDGAYTVTTTTTEGTAMLIAASFNGTTMVDAKVATIDAATAVDGVISGTITGLANGMSVKLFLWDSETLRPCIEPKVIQKKVIFIGDSNVYWGRAVEANSSNKLSNRQNDEGIFYQICKANGIDISVTNWAYGSHGWWALFDTEECTVNSSCGGINHEEALTDRNYDYVFLGLTRSATDEANLDAYMTEITGLFREANPNVEIIVLAPTMIYGISDTGEVREGTIASLKTMEEKYNVKVADWGRIVYDILEGNVTVPGTTQEWVKNTFVVKDKKHVNLLGGYMTSLMAYCVATGEKAEGQSYDFFEDTAILDVAAYATKYYTNGDADTNFPEILASPTEMKGIQQLIDKYIAEKPYLN